MKTAFPNLRSPVEITLYSNIPFDNTYKNHTIISDLFKYNGTNIYYDPYAQRTAKERFIDRRKYNNVDEYYYPRYQKLGEFNFDYSNGLVTSVTLELTPAQTNANYMKVKCGNDVYYYFINSIKQVNYDTYILSLELDVLMTYQDEFLEGVKDIPVFTTRKMSHRYYNGHIFSYDYKLGESVFANTKPSIVEYTKEAKLTLDDEITTGSETKFSDMLWIYITTDIVDKTHYVLGNEKCDNLHPFSVLVAPLGHTILLYNKDDHSINYSIFLTSSTISKLINDGSFKCATISPYPPFATLDNSHITIVDGSVAGGISIYGEESNYGEHYHITSTGGNVDFGGNTLVFGDNLANDTDKSNLLKNFFVLTIQRDYEYPFKKLHYESFEKPNISILNARAVEPKLSFEPFSKYCLTSAGSEEHEFFPELLCGLSPFQNSSHDAPDLYLSTIKTAYAGDFTTFTYIKPIELNNKIGFYDYKLNKIGLSASPNYTFPVGTDALDVFKSTQSETFYQSKIASGITSGLTIAGGVGSMALGIAGAVGSMGMSTPMSIGMIAGGAGGIASGTASLVNTIKSSNAKIEDLQNTPNTLNVAGSSYAHDFAMNINNCLPCVVKYTCSPVVKEKASDYFYNYGYEVARDCYFNTELMFENNQIDNNIFGRTIFNYVQTNEDITNKINADIPVIVKKKLSSIFMEGITLWSFFGLEELWKGTISPTINIDDYFLKHYYDNTEYNQ